MLPKKKKKKKKNMRPLPEHYKKISEKLFFLRRKEIISLNLRNWDKSKIQSFVTEFIQKMLKYIFKK